MQSLEQLEANVAKSNTFLESLVLTVLCRHQCTTESDTIAGPLPRGYGHLGAQVNYSGCPRGVQSKGVQEGIFTRVVHLGR